MRFNPLLAAAALLLVFTGQAPAQPTPAEAAQLSPSELRKAVRAQMPPPPPHFQWEVYENVVFLKPNGWHERELPASERSFPVLTYGTGPGKFNPDARPEKGLVINVFNGTRRLTALEARKAALVFLKPFLDARRKEDVLILDRKATGSYERFVFRYKAYPQDRQPVIVHIYIIANDDTDSFQVFTFEAPAQTWDRDWARYGEPMIGRAQVIGTPAGR